MFVFLKRALYASVLSLLLSGCVQTQNVAQVPFTVGNFRYELKNANGLPIHFYLCEKPSVCGADGKVSIVFYRRENVTFESFVEMRRVVLAALRERLSPGEHMEEIPPTHKGGGADPVQIMISDRRNTFPDGRTIYTTTRWIVVSEHVVELISSSANAAIAKKNADLVGAAGMIIAAMNKSAQTQSNPSAQ